MKDRCYDPSHVSFAHYGGRGITVCDKWRKYFLSFVDDMGDRPEDHTLNRIDNSGDYTPDNCEWATHSTQMSNRRGWFKSVATNITPYRGKWRVQLRLVSGLPKRHCRLFADLTTAQLYRDECLYERSFHRALGLTG